MDNNSSSGRTASSGSGSGSSPWTLQAPPGDQPRARAQSSLMSKQKELVQARLIKARKECDAMRQEIDTMHKTMIATMLETEEISKQTAGVRESFRQLRAKQQAMVDELKLENSSDTVQQKRLREALTEKAEAQQAVRDLQAECDKVQAEIRSTQTDIDFNILLNTQDDAISMVSMDSSVMTPAIATHSIDIRGPPSDDNSPTSSVRTSPVPSPRPPRAGSAAIRLYRALHPYEALDFDELNLAPGDVIVHIPDNSGDEGWLKGECNGKIGWFPENFVDLVELPPAAAARAPSEAAPNPFMSSHALKDTHVKAVAIFPWKARKPNQLSFPNGAIINVRKQGDSWWAGELNGKVGWFPKSYVKPIATDKKASVFSDGQGQSQAQQQGQSQGQQQAGQGSAPPIVKKDSVSASAQGPKKYVAIYPYEASERGELTFAVGDVIMVTKAVGQWWEGTCGSKTGTFPRNYVKEA
eukprot:m.108591 g.108591  ORF g.108591 m.108591 type:complete len:469 (+) comp15871_c3_seq1:355-1761(+)